ncbi:MAG: hypothetical protein KAR20_09840 [Candidatus Heimdallarchaeota archaeon]|nr:hypothetical protein [Candidatus Heimdallarchaeota archaeon]
MLKDLGVDIDEVKEEIRYEIERWFECVDFDFVIERLTDKEVLPENAFDELKVYDEVYSLIEEEVGNILFKK